MTTTPENSDLQRRTFRLRGYDYTQPGAYFVTICTAERLCVLGDVVDGQVALSRDRRIVARAWTGLANHYGHVEFDAFVVMSNHVHGVIMLADAINETGRAGLKPAPTTRHALREIVRAFKTFSARRVNIDRDSIGEPVWQRNYYEHVVRNERELEAVREYILANPAKWEEDEDSPVLASPRGPARRDRGPAEHAGA